MTNDKNNNEKKLNIEVILEAIKEYEIFKHNTKHRKSVIAELRLTLQKELGIKADEWT